MKGCTRMPTPALNADRVFGASCVALCPLGSDGKCDCGGLCIGCMSLQINTAASAATTAAQA